jgi:hypothetical protein
MFTHHVTMNLKDDSHRQLSDKISKSIMPFLREQKGFIDGVTLLAPERSTAIEDTHWETREDAEAYQLTSYLKVAGMLSEFVRGTPKDSIFEVPVGSIYQIGMERPYLVNGELDA